MYHKGVALRREENKQAKQAIARDREELLALENEKDVLENLVKQLEGIILICLSLNIYVLWSISL